MASLLRCIARFSRRKLLSPRHISTVSRATTSSTQLLEEETLPFYEHHQFYPARIGEVFKSRYQVLGKLGYGAFSTVWLCRDLKSAQSFSYNHYVSLKVSTIDFSKQNHELELYGRLSSLLGPMEVIAVLCIRQCSLQSWTYCEKNPEKRLNRTFVRMLLRHILTVLDFLHTEADIVHTDLKADNVMLAIADDSVLQDFKKSEQENPSPCKIIDDTRSIYTSRQLRNPRNGDWGCPVLCDLGQARIGQSHSTDSGEPQPDAYRSPEVLFMIPWGHKIDIWNAAAFIWGLLEGRRVFSNIRDKDGEYNPYKHLAQVVAYLGRPPKELLSRSEISSYCFDENGNWIADDEAKLPPIALEDLETQLEGTDKKLFLQLIRSMLTWLPEERKSAGELLRHPWLADT